MIEKTGFVIVNYCTSDDVQLCIESVFQYLDNENFIIIVVDNNSPDKSGKKLQEKYDNEKKCEVILNNSNLGYARGNNIGGVFGATNFGSGGRGGEIWCESSILVQIRQGKRRWNALQMERMHQKRNNAPLKAGSSCLREMSGRSALLR